MRKLIYLDNAATTKLKPQVLNEMMPYFCDEYANPSAMYKFAKTSEEAVSQARSRVASIINASKNEIIFTSGGSEADNWAIKEYAHFVSNKKGIKNCHIITSQIEHKAVLNSCRRLEDEGFQITYLPCDKYGTVKLDALKEAINENTILITIMTANNEIGTIQPIKQIGYIARSRNIMFHTDSVQAYGHIPINVREQMIDMMSVSAHKLGGPKGVGMLYIKKGLEFPSLIDGGSQENGMRAGTTNVPGIVGFGAAASMAARNMQANNHKILALRNRLIRGIRKNIPDSLLTGHEMLRLPGNAHFCFKDIESGEIIKRLDDAGICVSAGSACFAGAGKPSHVMKALNLPPEFARGAVRFTLSEENTFDEIDFVLAQITQIIAFLRKKQ